MPRHSHDSGKEAFSIQLRNLMLEKGWNQSELARQAGLNRDNVSTYINGKSMPSPERLKKLATALGVAPDELRPNTANVAISRGAPTFELTVQAHAPDKAQVRLERIMSMRTALKIAELLSDEDEPSGQIRSN
ncbi:helix-turn-helix domain-containing protein [Aquibaculum arenosum]|uniref:Helix-turn-helix domain-containing protein n=1 Tax=Aquibaculum arenosum TaxID=3032591 RepID=A0ABT5YLG0_9PROT|nr:helix-turn-helix domain-containing protein [Fodinicurvata sp. CAU 1616]MDF2095790.1 helix-turn-helix domain-containing protein [Fodinicurvata sp. CAU 1616]